ncbi:S66 peptidase family protein [Sporolactobacillus spathodeae]|uniref:Muramoyltetrapeptide carboxypeptidase LdcA involved in peptidoglycan recycling n=1 Tax=Sporolactobacillus spathodeae TaxID=1465502 RepID=A0ABS2Q6X3_9BACL|nr:LD-carboxypeptidase [Sporolactobacillus spathodeae]MBM7657478.1 muramoyltetrapeptide carboxypeptidase LdcA involved in peptidoglycan recycling [Sporolactobacillus spathodeae]
MRFLKKGDAVGLISCSDGWNSSDKPSLDYIVRVLSSLGLNVRIAETIFQLKNTPFSGSPIQRATELMKLFRDPEIRMIFDVSGGDSANQILPYLDYAAIQQSQAVFCGISDLTVVTNSLYSQCGHRSIHYRIKNLTGDCAAEQLNWFKAAFMKDGSIPAIDYHWLRGSQMSGVLIGGNLRCALKLAATRYFPDPTDKIILLESLGGGAARTATLLAQLDQADVFSKCSGILLGTFTTMEQSGAQPSVRKQILGITAPYQLPVAETSQIGHGEDAYGIEIGAMLHFSASANLQ